LTEDASSKSLYRSATRAACLGLAVNAALGVAKLVGGLLGQSFALISDAVNSFGDCLTSLVVIYGLRVAQRPPDSEHPYVEKLWVRKTGLEYLADIHIEVDASMTVAEGHRIGHCVKDRLVATFPALRDVLVHLEPYPPVNSRGN
jgi:divalent metal cation (Fe/Co/Zn/Cd) transporter